MNLKDQSADDTVSDLGSVIRFTATFFIFEKKLLNFESKMCRGPVFLKNIKFSKSGKKVYKNPTFQLPAGEAVCFTMA